MQCYFATLTKDLNQVSKSPQEKKGFPVLVLTSCYISTISRTNWFCVALLSEPQFWGKYSVTVTIGSTHYRLYLESIIIFNKTLFPNHHWHFPPSVDNLCTLLDSEIGNKRMGKKQGETKVCWTKASEQTPGIGGWRWGDLRAPKKARVVVGRIWGSILY